MKIGKLKCKKCGSENLIVCKKDKSYPHTKIICGDCGAFVKFANKNEKNLIKENE